MCKREWRIKSPDCEALAVLSWSEEGPDYLMCSRTISLALEERQ